ncbi:MAG TPA: hypothetical protein VMF03_03635 [Steroidobacteraceae bacterium]|nr:hypothetical protein [Steroidobacteraceae bacterium]
MTTYFSDQPFHTKYQARAGDTVVNLASRRGFSNPGPLVAYPPNRALLARKFGPNFLAVSQEFPLSNGDLFYLPWREEALRNLVNVFEKLIADTRKDSDDMIQGLMKDKEELESFLMKLDIMAVASGAVIGTFAAAGVYAAELKGVESVYLTKIIKSDVGDFLLGRFLNVGGVVSVATDAPSATRKRWDSLRLLVRHTLNVTSPSYWASIMVAISQGDADIWWSGPDHIAADKAREIAAHAKSEIQNFQNGVNAAKRQLALPFYRHRM